MCVFDILIDASMTTLDDSLHYICMTDMSLEVNLHDARERELG